MISFSSLSGKPLEEWFEKLFKDELKFDKYVSSKGQISLISIDPSQAPGEHLEIDGALLVNTTCVLLEYTDQKNDPKDKIRKFIRNVKIFRQSPKSLREKFEIFGVPEELCEDFSEVKEWKYIFIGTADAYEKGNYSRIDFPEDNEIQQKLYILSPSEIEYLRGLAEDIGQFAKNEFLHSLGFSASDLGAEESIRLNFFEIPNKLLSDSVPHKANLYLTGIKINHLLNIAKVSRYEGITVEDSEEITYQRLFKKAKLKSISKNFIKNNKRRMFPNTITVVLSNDCNIIDGSLVIPKRYGAVEIIDGQHRLFSYAHESISEAIREVSEIAVSAIMFQDATDAEVDKYAGRIFCEINSNQDKVTNNFIYKLKFDELGHRDYTSIACKILMLCNIKERSALSGVFTCENNIKINEYGLPPLPLPTVVDNDLEPFLKGLDTNGKSIDNSHYKVIFGVDKSEADENPEVLIPKVKPEIEKYFSFVKQSFPKDWNPNSGSEIFKAKFVSAFLKFLRHLLFNEKKKWTEVKASIKKLKANIEVKVGKGMVFDGKGEKGIPTGKGSPREIFNALKDIYLES